MLGKWTYRSMEAGETLIEVTLALAILSMVLLATFKLVKFRLRGQ